MMQNFACNCLNVRIRAAPANSMNPDELNSALRDIKQDTCPEFGGFVQNSRLVKIGHEPIQIRHPFLCGHRLIGNKGWSLCICSACDIITHAVKIGERQIDLDAMDAGRFMADDNLGLHSIGGLVLVNSAMLSDDQSIDSLRASPNFSPVFDIVVPPAQLSGQTPSSANAGSVSPFSHPLAGSRLGSVGSIDWTPPSSLSSAELVPQILDNVRDYIKQQHKAKDERIRGFVIEQERAFDSLCESVQLSRLNFVHLVESLRRRRHFSADNDKENRTKASAIGASSVGPGVGGGAGVGQPSDRQQQMDGFDLFSLENHSEFSRRVGVMPPNSVGALKHQQQQQQQQKLQQSPQQQQKQVKTSKRFARLSDYDDLFQMDDIDAERAEFGTVDEEPEDELPDVENDNVNFSALSHQQTLDSDMKSAQVPLGNAGTNQLVVNNQSGDRIRKVSNVRDVPFSYRDSRNVSKPFGGISLPIPIPIHLQAQRNDAEDDNSTEEGDIADRMLKMTRSVRNNENFELEDRPRRRLNTCDLIDSSRLRAMYE